MCEPFDERDHPAGMGGVQRIYKFPNGYGVSVIRFKFSYGMDEGLWELAVLDFVDHKGKVGSYSITYDTPVTSDVEGNLTDDAVDKLLTEIEALPLHPAKITDERQGEGLDK